MTEFLTIALGFILTMLALGLVRILRGPGDADRMMAAQLIGTGGIAALLLLGASVLRGLFTMVQNYYSEAVGHHIGYEHGFSHQVVDFTRAVADGTQPEPSFADGLHVQRALAAVEASAGAGSAWTAV